MTADANGDRRRYINRKCLGGCGRFTQSLTQKCRGCTNNVGPYFGDDIALVGGSWVPTGTGTVKWVAA